MMNKLGNAILKDLGECVKKFYFENGKRLIIEYLPLKQTVEFINGQGFLYNFETNNITVIKTNEIKKYKIDNERLYEQLKEIIG